MDKRYCILDMDGTILDTMGYWRTLAGDYLRSKGVQPDERLGKLKWMTLLQGAQYFIEIYGLEGPAQKLADEMNAVMERHYLVDVNPKPGAAEALKALRGRGARLCVATATNRRLAESCFARLGLLDLFDFVISCEDTGTSKASPDIYLQAAARLGAEPYEVAVFEDALHAARTAKAAGFYLVGIYDKQEKNVQALKELCDEWMDGWQDLRLPEL